jgi:hypothetical protein
MDSWLNVAGQSTFQCNFQIAHQIKTPMSHLLYSRAFNGSIQPLYRRYPPIADRARYRPLFDSGPWGVALEVFRGETFRQPSFPGELLANERRRDTICRWSPHVSGLDKIFLGERGGTRTLDPMIKSHVLYHLSYALTCRAV